MTYLFSVLIVSVVAFLVGSIPFGLLISRTFCGLDPRLDGSHNVGATNVSRLCGFRWGIATLACDMLKGFLPVLLFTQSQTLHSLAYPVGLALICGHMYSFFLDFKGGKGVATTVGVFFALAPAHMILAGLACLLTIWRTGFVSAGSLVLVSTLPLLFLLTGRWASLVLALLVAGLVFYAHRANIRRLLRGEEKPWLKKK